MAMHRKFYKKTPIYVVEDHNEVCRAMLYAPGFVDITLWIYVCYPHHIRRPIGERYTLPGVTLFPVTL